ncbi:hypothetical protein ABFS82_02G043400 [Erythranthe guttata]|nr:PREDICTED: zinc finger protein AZF2-like [Erythranthe guttata]|eukprot:XP_012836723.1 PREDICTED: zinc finger protein AZF2-like [Erythranthe guttata]
MAVDRSLNSAAPLKKPRRFDSVDQPRGGGGGGVVVVGKWKKLSRRSGRTRRRLPPEGNERFAAFLLRLARSGCGPPPAAAANHSTGEAEPSGNKPAAAGPSTGKSGNNPVSPVITTTTSAAAPADHSDVKISKESVPTTPPAAARSFGCSECGKGFSSYQALGGHKTSHRLKLPIAAAIDGDDDRTPYAAVIPAAKPSGKLHECDVCHKSFDSGQALGGHKRRHYEGVIGGGSTKNRKTSSNGGATSSNQMPAAPAAVIWDFDLNLPPPDDLEVESAPPPLIYSYEHYF